MYWILHSIRRHYFYHVVIITTHFNQTREITNFYHTHTYPKPQITYITANPANNGQQSRRSRMTYICLQTTALPFICDRSEPALHRSYHWTFEQKPWMTMSASTVSVVPFVPLHISGKWTVVTARTNLWYSNRNMARHLNDVHTFITL